MDVTQFQLFRSPRAAATAAVPAPDADLVSQLALIGQGQSTLTVTLAAQAVARFLDRSPDPFAALSGPSPDTDLQRVCWVIGQFDQWLSQQGDHVPRSSWQPALESLVKPQAQALGLDGDAWLQLWAAAGAYLMDHMVACVVERRYAEAADLVRSWLVQQLPLTAAATAEQTWVQLHATSVHFPEALDGVFPDAAVKLVREASVGDLYVIRNEWRCYVKGELAAIKNVLPGERHEQTVKHLRELETTQTSETQKRVEEESTRETSENSELSRETTQQLHAEINGHVNAEVQQSWGTGSVNVSGGVEGRLSMDQSQRYATRLARSSTAKAVSRVDSLTRQSRVRRELERSEEIQVDALENGTGAIVRGIYRWVDRIDRYQIVRFPDRLQLEFQLPEPGEYLRWLEKARQTRDALEQPPAWDLDLADIGEDRDEVLALAKTYRATGLPSLPAESVTVTQATSGQATDLPDDIPAVAGETLTTPMVNKEVELLVPAGYQADKVTVRARATPVFGKWYGENKETTANVAIVGYHFSQLNVMGGGQSRSASNSVSTGIASPRILQKADGSLLRYEGIIVDVGLDASHPEEIPFEPPAIDKVVLTVQAVGVSSVSASFAMTCSRTQQALDTWRQAVYDQLYDAWSQWKREWDNARSRAAELDLVMGSGSPTKLAALMATEVKRQVIGWLLDASPFQGYDNLLPAGTGTPAPWRDIDHVKARETAPVIQFMEQAFEWGNMQYVLYPYFWADRDRWDELQSVQSSDPDFERFLKAGSARVVLPARKAMTQAVQHWLAYGEPFLSRPLPLPGNPLYVSLAQEVQDITRPPDDGVPGDSWEVRVGTAMVLLDHDDNLPINDSGSLGAAPNLPSPRLSPASQP